MSNKKREYKVLLDGRWTLEDLNVFSRLYFQNYSFIYCLDTKSVKTASDRMVSVLEEYELRHGLSYVNIYSIFKSNVPEHERPVVKSIKYSSPGWLELLLNPEVAAETAKSIGIYTGAIGTSGMAAGVAYKELYKIYAALSKIRKEKRNEDLQLEALYVERVNKLNNELAKGLGFDSLKELDKHTKNTEESSKLMMAHYRRTNKIAEFVRKGKASFPIKK